MVPHLEGFAKSYCFSFVNDMFSNQDEAKNGVQTDRLIIMDYVCQGLWQGTTQEEIGMLWN